jgi:hypothetical protein
LRQGEDHVTLANELQLVGAYLAPASVGETLRVVLASSRTPMSSSSRRMA